MDNGKKKWKIIDAKCDGIRVEDDKYVNVYNKGRMFTSSQLGRVPGEFVVNLASEYQSSITEALNRKVIRIDYCVDVQSLSLFKFRKAAVFLRRKGAHPKRGWFGKLSHNAEYSHSVDNRFVLATYDLDCVKHPAYLGSDTTRIELRHQPIDLRVKDLAGYSPLPFLQPHWWCFYELETSPPGRADRRIEFMEFNHLYRVKWSSMDEAYHSVMSAHGYRNRCLAGIIKPHFKINQLLTEAHEAVLSSWKQWLSANPTPVYPNCHFLIVAEATMPSGIES